MPLTGLEIRGVIFDLDGVLMESAECHRIAFQQVFEQFGINDFQYSSYAGWRTRDVVADVLQRKGRIASAVEIGAASSGKTLLARELLDAQRPVSPDCGSVLAKLAALYPLGLASSGSRASVDAFLNWTGSRTLFASVLSGEDVREAKPNPEIYLRSAEKLRIPASKCAVVEDAVAGLAAARATSAIVIGMAGSVAASLLREAGAAHVISRLDELVELLVPHPAAPQRSSWTAVIPAAGRGSRLGFNRPKILYPVAGRMILHWLLDFLEPTCSRLVFVVSPDGAADVAAELERRIPGRFDIVIQPTPTGMGDAVDLALPQVKTPHVALVWGDQVALRRSSVEACLRLHQGPLQPDLTCPTVLRDQPYIHFQRNPQGHLCGLLQAREGSPMPEKGESDTGFFCCNTNKLAGLLQQLRASGQASGEHTREFNFLPIIPMAARQGVVLTPRIMRLEETMGINSSQDAMAVSAFLNAPTPSVPSGLGSDRGREN